MPGAGGAAGCAGAVLAGAAVEFTALVAARAKRVFALVNPAMPAIPGAASLPFAQFDLVAEAGTALPTYDVGVPSAEALAIARSVAGLVEDGSALQAGLGKVPEAMFGLLHHRRGLRLQSGMLGDGALALHRAGALDADFAHASCVWVGSAGLYEELRRTDGFAVLGCEVTHDIARLAQAKRFLAVNSALTVDLFGQANLEHAGGRAVSGVGDAPDFAQAARLSKGCISVVALLATYGTPARSRIVPRIAAGWCRCRGRWWTWSSPRTGSRTCAASRCRAEALIAIAAPALQGELYAAWGEIMQQL